MRGGKSWLSIYDIWVTKYYFAHENNVLKVKKEESLKCKDFF